MLPSQMKPAFDGTFPCTLVTSTQDEVPNITNLSRVWYIDEDHVAIANQFLNKAESNLKQNPLASIKIANPNDLYHWELTVKYIHSEMEGPLFEAMRHDLHTVSWMAGFSNSVNLRAAMIFQVTSIRKCLEEILHLAPAPELFADLLQALGTEFEWNRLSYWVTREDSASLQLSASRGVPGAGTNTSALEPMKRLAGLVAAERRIIRLINIRSQIRYLHHINSEEENRFQDGGSAYPGTMLPTSFFAFPIMAFDSVIGIVCYEETEANKDSITRIDNDYITLLSRKIGETLSTMTYVVEKDREPFFKQVIERTRLEWTKAKDPFHTVLSARERQVSIYVAKGHTNAEIAQALFVSIRTVTTHLERVFLKLQVTSRTALTRYIIEKGLLTDQTEG
ncbi:MULTISPECIES: response regulator transcription factor [unclassified Paenibacillus]|uniref:response regulator transcription factor n=1 Tax=unclassified Paenibacillus TaxID=185978 RepID=UPI003644D2F0